MMLIHHHRHCHPDTADWWWTQGGEDGLTGLVVTEIRVMDDIIEPQMRHCHPVLCECTSLVRTDCRRRPHCLYCLKVLHQTVLACHSLGSTSETDLQSLAATHWTMYHYSSQWCSSRDLSLGLETSWDSNVQVLVLVLNLWVLVLVLVLDAWVLTTFC